MLSIEKLIFKQNFKNMDKDTAGKIIATCFGVLLFNPAYFFDTSLVIEISVAIILVFIVLLIIFTNDKYSNTCSEINRLMIYDKECLDIINEYNSKSQKENIIRAKYVYGKSNFFSTQSKSKTEYDKKISKIMTDEGLHLAYQEYKTQTLIKQKRAERYSKRVKLKEQYKLEIFSLFGLKNKCNSLDLIERIKKISEDPLKLIVLWQDYNLIKSINQNEYEIDDDLKKEKEKWTNERREQLIQEEKLKELNSVSVYDENKVHKIYAETKGYEISQYLYSVNTNVQHFDSTLLNLLIDEYKKSSSSNNYSSPSLSNLHPDFKKWIISNGHNIIKQYNSKCTETIEAHKNKLEQRKLRLLSRNELTFEKGEITEEIYKSNIFHINGGFYNFVRFHKQTLDMDFL